MTTDKPCPHCGATLAADALLGLCPDCLLKAGVPTGSEAGEPGAGGKFEPPTPAELARFFPQLEILALIGRGGMGAVYKARQTQLDRFVAVKILPPGVSDDPAFAERFTHEARALAKLNHPNIVTLYEFGVAGRGDTPVAPRTSGDKGGAAPGVFYFIMEFVDGMNLRQLLQSGRIAPREALAIVPQICDALQYAHDAGIVHRDIKPENILLDRRGRVKVADFGLAKLVGVPPAVADPGQPASPLPATGTTGAGQILGTPQYMAPEQREHPTDVDHRADIYSLGVVFYQMLTGELPKGDLAPPSRQVVVDVRLDEVVLRAMEQRPELRYQQISEVKTLVETIACTPGGAADAATKKSGMVRILEVFTGETFKSPLAIKLVNLSALGFLGSLGFLGALPLPGWQRCAGFFGLYGFFGFIGLAFIAERFARVPPVGLRDSRRVVNWPSVVFLYLICLVAAGTVTALGSLVLVNRVAPLPMLAALLSAAGAVAGIVIALRYFAPAGRLKLLDKPATVAPPQVPSLGKTGAADFQAVGKAAPGAGGDERQGGWWRVLLSVVVQSAAAVPLLAFMTYIVPKFEVMARDVATHLPGATVCAVKATNFAVQYWWLWSAVALLTSWALQRRGGRKWLWRWTIGVAVLVFAWFVVLVAVVIIPMMVYGPQVIHGAPVRGAVTPEAGVPESDHRQAAPSHAPVAASVGTVDIQPSRKEVVIFSDGRWAANTSSASNSVEVILTGQEQALVERFVEKTAEPVHGMFSNALDHALAVLLTKGYPQPDVTRLARATVESLCRESGRQTGGNTGAAQQETWVATVARTQRFDALLKELGALGAKQDRLIEAGLHGMLASSGWAAQGVLPKEQADDFKRLMHARETATEERGLVGVKLDRWPAVEVVPDGPAADAGVRSGDVVVAVNGKAAADASTVQDALKILQGRAGSVVKLAVRRDGTARTFDVTRGFAAAARVEARQVATHVLLIAIPTFEGSGIADRVKRIIRAHSTGQTAVIIFDLRNNPGGRPEEVNAVADLFLDGKLLWLCAFRDGRLIGFKSNPGVRSAARLILLTNKLSASGAEILAMALRDNSRATLVGEATAGALFGKDLAELVGGPTIFFRTEPAVLSITGQDYSTTGVPPDIPVRDSRSPEKDDILLRALELAQQPVPSAGKPRT